MRIYAVADIHGKSERFIRMQRVVAEYSPDILVVAGDMTNLISPLKVLRRLSRFKLPVFCIRGNFEFKGFERLTRNFDNITVLNHNPLMHRGVSFLGANGTILLPFLSKICLWETRGLRKLADQVTHKSILVVHPPPRGVLDKVANRFRAGSVGLKRLIQHHPPAMVICGHIHEQAGYQFLKNTLIVNAAMNKTAGGAVIDVDEDLQFKVTMV